MIPPWAIATRMPVSGVRAESCYLADPSVFGLSNLARQLPAHIHPGDRFFNNDKQPLAAALPFPQFADDALFLGVVALGEKRAFVLHHEQATVFELGDEVGVELIRRGG